MLRRFMPSEYRPLEKRLGYRFSEKALLKMAFTHRSFRYETDGVEHDNQRLEFLGDAVLGFLAAVYLYEVFPDKEEGELTGMRSRLASGKMLAEIADELGLSPFLQIGKGEEQSGGRTRRSNLTDAMEAILGAAYLDGGLKAVQKVFQTVFVPRLEAMAHHSWADNPKGLLQKVVQEKFAAGPVYRVVQRDGPAHETTFRVEVTANGAVLGAGSGGSKQDAEREAAVHALRGLDIDTSAVIR